jgi:SAM-dependent methyltransferase
MERKPYPPAYYEEAAEAEYRQTASSYAARDVKKWQQPSGTNLALRAICRAYAPKRILELGVGTGRYFPCLTGQQYLGIDISPSMLSFAKRRKRMLTEQGFQSVEIRHEEIHTFLAQEHAEGAFDLVVSIGCLSYHLPITLEVMQRVSRMLTLGGRFFLQATQWSLHYKMGRIIKRVSGITTRPSENYDFFSCTDSRELRRLAKQAELHVQWIREDSTRWFGKPLLLCLFRKNP